MQDDYGNAIGNAKTINERLQMLGASMDEVRGSLRAGDERMTRIEDNASTLREELASNTQATKQVADKAPASAVRKKASCVLILSTR